MGGIGNGRLISIMDLKIKHILGGRGGTGSRCSKTLCSTLFLEFECWDLELERMGWGGNGQECCVFPHYLGPQRLRGSRSEKAQNPFSVRSGTALSDRYKT